MSYANYDPSKINKNPATMKKYYAVVDEWLVNGYKAAEAYQSVYPNANRKTATDNFCCIKKIPEIAEYIAEQRQAAFDSQCIDLIRVTQEIAKMAFCPDGDKYVPASVKAKALEMLQKALREDAANSNKQEDVVTIELEGEEDENNSEKESV